MAQRVAELVERRSANAKHWLRDDGRIEAEFDAGPIHYRAEDGSWQDCDPTIERKTRTVDGDSYDRAATKLPHRVWFKRQAKAPLRLESPDGHVLILRAVGGNASTATIAGNVATYSEAWPDTDWRRTVTRWGVKSDLLLKAPTAPASFTFRVATALTPEASPDGAVRWRDGATLVAVFPAPTLTDAAGVSGPVAQRLTPDGADWLLTLEADRGWLDDPARVYPVVLDPTTVVLQPGAEGKDSYVDPGNPDTNYGTRAYLDTGYVAGYYLRSLIEFDLSTIPAEAYIASATLSLVEFNGPPAANWTLRRATAAWSESTVTWNTKPPETTTGEVPFTLAGSPTTYNLDVKAVVQQWVDGALPNYGWYIRKVDETAGTERAIFRSSDYATAAERPKLTVTYDLPTATPSSPTGTATSPGILTDEVTPQLQWTFSDPGSKPQSKYQVQVYDGAGLVYDSGEVASANTYHDVPLGAGLKYGTTYDSYNWRVRAKGSGWSPWSAVTYFRCVLSAVTGLTATGDAAAAEVDLAWTAHPAEKLAGYRVYRKKSTESSFAKLQDLVTATAHSDELAASGVTYDYRVAAVATDGYEGPQSSTASASVTITGFWIGDRQVTLREAVAYEYPRRASRRIATDSTWVVQDLGTLPRAARFALAFSTLAERDALLALFPKGQEFAYRDEDGEVFRGKVTGVIAEERLRVPGQYIGTLHFEATEVTA